MKWVPTSLRMDTRFYASNRFYAFLYALSASNSWSFESVVENYFKVYMLYADIGSEVRRFPVGLSDARKYPLSQMITKSPTIKNATL